MSQANKQQSQTNEKQWTVMVYFAADNNLEDVGFADLAKIKKAGSTDEVNLIAQLDPSGNGKTTRYYLQKDTFLDEDVLDDTLGEINTGDPEELVKFITWGIETFPAKHYMVILWGHGQGWQEDIQNPCRAAGRTVLKFVERGGRAAYAPEGAGSASFKDADQFPQDLFQKLPDSALGRFPREALPASFRDAPSDDALTMKEMQQAFAEVKKTLEEKTKDPEAKIDLLGMDACLMAMAEVGFQVKDSVRYLLGSEETVPIESWPYDSILADLITYPQMTPEQLAITAIRKYIFSYKDKKFVTQSVCDLGKADALAAAVGDLAKILREYLPVNDAFRWAVMKARSLCQSYYLKEYVDLYHFCELLQENWDEEPVASACDRVIKAISDDGSGFVMAYGLYGYPMKDSRGISVYFPDENKAPCYDDLDFAKQTNWHEFLNAHVERPPKAPKLKDKSGENGGPVAGTGNVSSITFGGMGDPILGGMGDPILVPADPIIRVPGRRLGGATSAPSTRPSKQAQEPGYDKRTKQRPPEQSS